MVKSVAPSRVDDNLFLPEETRGEINVLENKTYARDNELINNIHVRTICFASIEKRLWINFEKKTLFQWVVDPSYKSTINPM